ncbi:MAG: S9 family peptidase, partial [Bdellovibrionales bacterium]|nr:S9 family peptidase [Bdellovibrionales bacterium]
MKKLILFLNLVLITTCQIAKADYPPTFADPNVVDQRFGVDVYDPYRWLEADSQDRVSWLNLQNEFSRAQLELYPERDRIRKEIADFGSYSSYTLPQYFLGKFYYIENNNSGSQLKFTRRLGQNEKVLFDPNDYDDLKDFVVREFTISKCGKRMAIGLSRPGSEYFTYVIYDLKKKIIEFKFGSETKRYAQIYWMDDEKSFVGRILNSDQPGSSDSYFFTDLKTKNFQFFLVQANGPIQVTKNFVTIVDAINKSGKETLYISPLATKFDKFNFKTITALEDSTIVVLGEYQKKIVIWKYEATADTNIVSISYKHPEEVTDLLTIPGSSIWVSLIGDKVVSAQSNFGGQLAVAYSVRGRKLGELHPPTNGVVNAFNSFFDSGHGYKTFYYMSDPTNPASVYEWDLLTLKSKRVLDSFKSGGPEVTIEMKSVTARDGVEIPITVIKPKNAGDTPLPTVLAVYGAFGSIYPPSYTPENFQMIKSGGAIVIGHIRGGGYNGGPWHEAAIKENKIVSIYDAIDVAEGLKKSKISSSVALYGRSGGGVAVSGALAISPQSFDAVICSSGITDVYRLPNLINGHFEFEFGDPNVESEFFGMMKYNSIQKLQTPQALPPTLVT